MTLFFKKKDTAVSVCLKSINIITGGAFWMKECPMNVNPRLVLEFDLLFYAFGKLGTVTVAWAIMFSYTLSVPYYTLLFWGSLYHKVPSKMGLSLGMGLILYLIQTCILGVFPIYVVVHHQLPPASRFIVILEQVSLSHVQPLIFSFTAYSV